MKEEEESKLEDEIIVTNILPLLIQYMESKSFHKEIIDFLDEFSGNFDDIAESKQPEQEVQKLEFTDIFYKYQELLNQLIDGFARKHDTSIHIVFENCRDAVEGRYMPLFEEDPNKEFIESTLLSWLEYDHFLQLICQHTRNKRQYSSRK